jgi:hypothetical protein
MVLSSEEFARIVPPKRTRKGRSRLAPYRNELRDLKSKGYTYAQLQDYLLRNGVETSVANIADYFKRTAVMTTQAVAR